MDKKYAKELIHEGLLKILFFTIKICTGFTTDVIKMEKKRIHIIILNNIDLNNNVSDNDSNIDDSKEEELQFLTGRLTKRMIVIPSWKWCLMNKILK